MTEAKDIFSQFNCDLSKRVFTKEGVDPFSEIEWELRDVIIKNDTTGKVVFEAKGLEFPKSWSQTASQIVAEKYFRHVEQPDGTKVRETSVKQMINRVVNTIVWWGTLSGYFGDSGFKQKFKLNDTTAEATGLNFEIFRDELKYMLVNQMFAFNSPVWFNIGTTLDGFGKEQASACFLGDIEDSMESILENAKIEGMVYKGGSGYGVNYSKLRGSMESLSNGGVSSGPVPFMIKDDMNASAIKSAGNTRRAAKMVILDIDHPDLIEFIKSKGIVEKASKALVAAGFAQDFRDRWGASAIVPLQNGNQSVMISDKFMEAVERNGDWDLTARVGGSVTSTHKARELWDLLIQAAWDCADPGVIFADTVNNTHQTPNTAKVTTANPCRFNSSMILTPYGIREFKDIEIGSVIWQGERWTKVTAKWPTGTKPVFKYKTTAGSFTSTDNHHVFQDGERVEIKDAERLDTVQGPIPLVSKTELDPQDIMDGLVVGDGTTNHGVFEHLIIGNSDQDYFTSEIKQLITSTYLDNKTGIINAHVETTIKKLPYTYERYVPTEFKFGAPEKVLGFLRGLYSANGSIVGSGSYGRHRVTLKQSSLQLIEDVQVMLSSIGIRSYYTTNKESDVTFKNGTYTCKQSYDLNITTDKDIFFNKIGFIQKYKEEKLIKIVESKTYSNTRNSFEIVSVEPLGIHAVYDITVEDETHAYWSEGFRSSNCSEFLHIPWASCNLASVNVLNIKKPDSIKDLAPFLVTAMNILIDGAGFPHENFKKATHAVRPIGIGLSNLGAYLMADGLAYDSEKGRIEASKLYAELNTSCWVQSCYLASIDKPFPEYEKNKEAVYNAVWPQIVKDLAAPISLYKLIQGYGVKNSHVTNQAPVGTISFLMDCQTTGIEPELGLVKHKKLVGGDTIKMVNNMVPRALGRLGYDVQTILKIEDYILKNNSVVGSDVKPEHYSVFDTSFACTSGRSIAPMGHVKMMAAAQPFISSAISKTVNLPSTATKEDIGNIYMEAWKRGLKSIAVYRDGCKSSQPMEAGKKEETKTKTTVVENSITGTATFHESIGPAMSKEEFAERIKTPIVTNAKAASERYYASKGDKVPEESKVARRRLPDDCPSLRHKFDIGGHEGYLHVGMYDDGSPGEVFISMSKEGSSVSGLMDAIGVLTSVGLQHGVPLQSLVDKFAHTKFEPSGYTSNKDIKTATSVLDYVFRWLEKNFIDQKPVFTQVKDKAETTEKPVEAVPSKKEVIITGELCSICGGMMVRTGACNTCTNCGQTGGCG